MKSLLSVRSPLWQIVTTLLVYPLFILIAHNQETDSKAMTNSDILTLVYALIVMVYGGIYMIMLYQYNQKHPLTKVKVSGSIPAELKDEDEGMRMFTARATRSVYTYHSLALPISAAVIVLAPHTVYVAVMTLMILTLGHYITYMRAIWPLLRESSDE